MQYLTLNGKPDFFVYYKQIYMNRLLIKVLVIAAIFTNDTCVAQTQSFKQNNAFMIRHTVVFKLKPLKDSSALKYFFDAVSKLASIPGVENFECLKQTSKKNDFEFGISMEFANKQLYDEYNIHPLHVAFIREYWLKYVDRFLEIDYEQLKS